MRPPLLDHTGLECRELLVPAVVGRLGALVDDVGSGERRSKCCGVGDVGAVRDRSPRSCVPERVTTVGCVPAASSAATTARPTGPAPSTHVTLCARLDGWGGHGGVSLGGTVGQ